MRECRSGGNKNASYQMLEVLSFCDWEKDSKTSVIKNNRANFFGKKHNGALSRCIFYQMRDKTVKSRPRI